MGISEIKEVIKLAADGAKLGINIAKDGKVGIDELPLALKLVQDLPAAINGIDKVPAELADMDAAEAADLVAYAMSELGLEEGKAKLVVAASLKLLVAAGELVVALKA